MDTRTKVSICCDLLSVARKYDDSGLQKSIINLVGAILYPASEAKVSVSLLAQVKYAYENRGKLEAVKLYRSEMETSLLEAKRWVENKAAENGWKKYEH